MSAKFGAPIHEVRSLLVAARHLGLQPWGISFHVGSQCSDPHAWANGVVALTSTVEELIRDGIRLEILNLGGGFPVKYDNHVKIPSLRRISRAVRDAMARMPYQPAALVEPGRGLVATSTSLVSSVVSRVERDGRPWLYLDAGVYNALFEAMIFQGRTRYPMTARGKLPSDHRSLFVLAGPTGDGIDVVTEEAELPSTMAEGDRIVFGNVGAYAGAMASTFNGFPLPPIRPVERAGRRNQRSSKSSRHVSESTTRGRSK
jgi:ornithine decarboxylase